MYGLTAIEIKNIQSVFSAFGEVKEVIIYGSRAKGSYRNNSDIDLTIKGDNLSLQSIFNMEEKLDDLLLPYKLDLSLFDKIENKDLLEHIERVGLKFYKK